MQSSGDIFPAIRSVLAAYRSTEAHITEEQITASWAEYDSLRRAANLRAAAIALVEDINTYGEPRKHRDAIRAVEEATRVDR